MEKNERDTPLLSMKNIHAYYGEYHILKGVDFDLYRGEIHGLVGEHRAGKSTLVKLLSGAVRKARGDIWFDGQKFEYFTPKLALKHKIGVMYQESQLIPTMTAVENIFTGRDIANGWGWLKDRQMAARAKEIFALIGVEIPLNIPLKMLSEAAQHVVELAKVLSIDPNVLIFDEIANKFTPEEMEIIYRLLFQWKEEGKSVIYISHDMDEIFRFADRVTILHNGYLRGTEEVRDLDRVKLIKLTYSFVMSREELESDNRELYLLKKYNENIIKNLPEGVIILDPEQVVYLANYAAARILGLDEQAMLRQGVQSIFPANSIEHAAEILEKISRQEEEAWDDVKYGQEKILKIQIFPFKDEDYKFLGTIIIIADVSQERYFNEYLLRVQKIASVAEVAAGVAHEINNPLGIIQNYITLLKRKPAIDDDSQQKLSKVEDELQRISGIVESLLSFSRRKTLPMKRVNLAAVLDETLLLLNHKLKEKQIALRRTQNADEAPIIGDENQLKQVIMNLVVNSIDAVAEAGTIEIALNARQEEGYVELAVTDNGSGIPPEVMDKIFDPFFSTKLGKKNTGLGLSICQHIIEAHQGIITCASAEKTIFNIRLPIAEN